MPFWFSIIILASNDQRTIGDTLKVLIGLTDDVLVLVNNSSDATAEIASQYGVQVIDTQWIGYGPTKNQGHTLAKYPWILSLDADEELDTTLIQNLRELKEPQQINIVFRFNMLMEYNGKVLHYGASPKLKRRLFHRDFASWSDSLVHEMLEYKATPTFTNVKGIIIHHSYANEDAAYQKMGKYALSMAKQRVLNGRAPTKIAVLFAGAWRFFYVYIIRLGFLDGRAGLAFARLDQYYTNEKYKQWKLLAQTPN